MALALQHLEHNSSVPLRIGHWHAVVLGNLLSLLGSIDEGVSLALKPPGDILMILAEERIGHSVVAILEVQYTLLQTPQQGGVARLCLYRLCVNILGCVYIIV